MITPEITAVEPVVETPIAEPQVETPVAEPVAEPVVAPVVPEPELVYEYQPLDDMNRPLGAKQVFKAKTQQELIDKIAKAHQEAIKLNRELKKNIRLGKFERDELPEDSVYNDTNVDFTPRALTAEERFKISQELLDPAKCDEAAEILLEASFGAKPEVLRDNLRRNNEILEQLQAKAESDFFMKTNPDYYPCLENFETMTNWMLKNDLKPVRQNFQLAFNTLRAAGLLLDAPIVREEIQHTPVAPEPSAVEPSLVETQPEPEPVSRITDAEPQTQQRRTSKIPTGLNRSNTSDAGTPVQTPGKLTVKDIERMPAEEYKRKLKDPSFQKMVDELYAPKKQQ